MELVVELLAVVGFAQLLLFCSAVGLIAIVIGLSGRAEDR
jgi:hypothetical protein